jgi:glycine oxidase
MADVAIVGAGLIGLSIAYELAQRGAEVIVYDRDEPARAASWAGAGMLAPYSESVADPAMLALCRASLDAYPAFVTELAHRSGVDAYFAVEGTLHVARDDAELARLVARVPEMRANGGDAVVLDRAEVLAREPFVTTAAVGGVFVANEAQVDNRRLGRALVAAARQLGVRFERAAQIALEHDARRVRGVRIPTGFASATTVVNAAGAWAGALDGVPEHARIEIRAVAGEMLALAVPAGALRALIWRGNRYLVPRSDARVLVGATVEERGEDARVTAAGMHDLLDFALGVAPALRSFAVVETWAGLRPASPDGLPYLGATALDGYVVAAGHYRNGILLTPLTGRLIAQLIVDGSATGLEPFSPLRVREAQRVGANRSA